MASKVMETKRNCVQACDYCKLKKRKCVKEGDRCTYCTTNGQECTYRNLNRKRGRMGERKKKKSKSYQDYVYPIHYQDMVNLDMMINFDIMNMNLDNINNNINSNNLDSNISNMGLAMVSSETQPSSPHNILFTPTEQYISLNYEDCFSNETSSNQDLTQDSNQCSDSSHHEFKFNFNSNYNFNFKQPLQPFLEIFHSVPNELITSMVSREQLEEMANSTPTPTSLLLLYTMAALAGICHPTAHDRTSGMEWYFMAVDQLRTLQKYEFPCQVARDQFNTAAFLLDFIKVA